MSTRTYYPLLTGDVYAQHAYIFHSSIVADVSHVPYGRGSTDHPLSLGEIREDSQNRKRLFISLYQEV